MDPHPTPAGRTRRSRWPVAAAAATCALVLVACGSSANKPSSGSGATQTVVDALEYRGRYRAYPGAITGMKPPQYAVWAFQQLGARAGDELVDLYPGSGAVSEAASR